MGRITVSLPDDVEAALDAYATQQGKPVSQVVADALRALLSGPVTQPAPSSERAGPVEDVAVRKYLTKLHGELALMLQTVQDLTLGSEIQPPHMPPYNLPEPNWRGRA